MRVVVDIRKQFEKGLEDRAWKEHRTVRELVSYWLHQKLEEELGETQSDLVVKAS